MNLYIIDDNQIRIFSLPIKIDEDYSFKYNGNHLITLTAQNNNWYLKSNGEVNVEDFQTTNNKIRDNILLTNYGKCHLKINGVPDKKTVYFIPNNNQGMYRFDISKAPNITIGSDSQCQLHFNNPFVIAMHALISFDSNAKSHFVMMNQETNSEVFLNNQRINGKKQLNAGDIIFIEGLKIIYMGTFIQINNPNNQIKINGLPPYTNNADKNNIYTQVKEDEKYIELYKDSDYFYHIPKIREEIITEEVVIDSPPGSQKQDDVPIILTIGSSITMAASTLMMGWNVGYGLVSKTRTIIQVVPQIVMCAAMIFGSLIIPKISSRYQKKKKKQWEELRQKKYTEYLKEKETAISTIIKNQELILRANNASINECANIILTKNKNYWSNEITDDNFLTVRLGLGTGVPNLIVKAPEEHFSLEVDNLLQDVYDMTSKYKKLNNIPITLSLTENNITSFIFNNKLKYEYIEGLMIQLIALHSPVELKIVVLTNETNKVKWQYAKVLSHCQSADKTQRFFATTVEEANELSNYLMDVLNERKASNPTPIPKGNVSNDKKKANYHMYDSYYLIVTDDYKNAKKLKVVNEILENENINLGFSLVAIDDSMKNLPTNSKVFINLGQNEGAIYSKSINSKNQISFINEYNLENDIYKLSSITANVPIEVKSGISVLPQSLSFLEMYGVSKIEQLNIYNRWKNNNPVTNLNAIIGVHTSGESFKLNLHEKFHGPHGLIAGSTGSGKSEFIITYILSMALNYHPHEVQFVLIDYKGGGLAGAFENKETGVKLPHLAGTITNLDTSEMNRTLVSIKSELKRRQKKFNEVRDKVGISTIDIYKYQQLYRDGTVTEPMSHLFIISDEFAELKSQQPEFMSQLISTARIGRSLGLHLILATQKPSGVVNEQIWSNSKFKVCLKVQDRSDSMEMLKRPEAASIKEAGRFYLQVGYDDYFDIGQSGWSGAKYIPSDKIIKKVDDTINFIDNVGNIIKTVDDNVEDTTKEIDYGDQLTNIVKYIYNLGQKENIVIQKMWLDAIPAEISLNNLKQKYSYKPIPYYIAPVIGEYDNPLNQEQGILTLDLTTGGNTVIFGQQGSGKEKLLTTLIWSTIIEHTPDEVSLYILDYGAEILKVYQNMPHVGEVITADQNNKNYDLMEMISEEIEKRKSLFANYGGNYTEYIKNTNDRMPLIVTIINNYEIFYENNPKLADGIQSLYRDGSKYGIVFIVTAISTNTVKARMAQNFNNKICLQIPNELDYRTTLKAPRGLVPSKIFGRGLVNVGDTAYEFQTASFVEQSQQVQLINAAATKLSQAYTSRAKKIPMIPDVVELNTLNQIIELNKMPIGYNIRTKQQFFYNFTANKITRIMTQLMNNDKLDFIYAIIKQISKLSQVIVIDFVEAYERNYENVILYNNNFNNTIVSLLNELQSKPNQNKFYIILGIGELKEKIEPNVYNSFNALLTNMSNYPNSYFIFIDTYNSYKKVQVEEWYQKNIDNSSGIWLGKEVGSQILINFSELSMEERRLEFSCMAFVSEKGNKTIIKHMVEREVSNNEE